MGYLLYFGLAAMILVLVVSFRIIWSKTRAKAVSIPDVCMGAIRVTDRDGRDMLIIRKEDGSFEMHEEQKIRKQCAS